MYKFKANKKIIILGLSLVIGFSVAGQNLHQKEGAVEIKMIHHYKLSNKKGKLTKKISNKENRPYKYLYLDTLGRLIKEVTYGHYHNTDLRLLGSTTIYKYDKSKLIEKIEYNNEYNNSMKTIYFYNEKKQLIKKGRKCPDSDSLNWQCDFTYDSIGNQIKACFDNTCYVRTFDNKGRLTSQKQFNRGSLNWEYVYTYTTTTRIGKFKFNDEKDYTKKEKVLYQNGKIKQVEEFRILKYGISMEKKKYCYNKSGIIKKIEYYEAYKDEDKEVGYGYRVKSYIDVETEIKGKLTKKLVKQINEIILDEVN